MILDFKLFIPCNKNKETFESIFKKISNILDKVVLIEILILVFHILKMKNKK